MRRLWNLLLFIMVSVPLLADTEQLLNELDAAISQRSQLIKAKEDRIAQLKEQIIHETNNRAVLKTTDALFNEYHVYQFDSAMTYAVRGLKLARKCNDTYYSQLFNIHTAEILAIGGLYVEAQECLDNIDTLLLSKQMLFQYYLTAYHVYSYWASYTHETDYSSRYWQMAKDNLSMCMCYLEEDDPDYDYYKGEYYNYIKGDTTKAQQHYLRVISQGNFNSRTIAMASYALAIYYQNTSQNKQLYEQYLIHAALSDLQSCTMESVAMKMLATLLFEEGQDNVGRAEVYINQSMEDAKFYNNRLRILETSRSLSQIMNSYQDMIERQNRGLRYSVIFISLLLIALFLTVYFIFRQNRKLHSRRQELAANNSQLTSLNEQLAVSIKRQSQLNAQLHELNQKLVDTNKRRESLASIYIDLCAKYIDKLGRYQTLVKRKIKANQAQELLQAISSERISEEDAATFLNRFDKAFLELSPTFVNELNALLTEEGRIQQKSPNALTTELRTFALIRLGVKNTADIAGLLFLSIQTIYNCRSVIKNRAINKETFDDDILKLCTVIQ